MWTPEYPSGVWVPIVRVGDIGGQLGGSGILFYNNCSVSLLCNVKALVLHVLCNGIFLSRLLLLCIEIKYTRSCNHYQPNASQKYKDQYNSYLHLTYQSST